MFAADKSSKKSEFLATAKAARSQRQAEKKREKAAVRVQAVVRGWMVRRRLRKEILEEFDKIFVAIQDDSGQSAALPVSKDTKLSLQSSQTAYKAAKNLFCFANESDYKGVRFERFCKYVLTSIESDSLKISYISVALNKTTAIAWISHMKQVLGICAETLGSFKFDTSGSNISELNTLLRMLVAFTSTNTWVILRAKNMERLLPGMNQLCANFMGHLVNDVGFMRHLNRLLLRGLCSSRVMLKKTALSAIFTLAMRPLISSNFSEKLISLFIMNILSLPGLIIHLENICPESLALLQKHEMLQKVIAALSQDQELKIHFNSLEGSYSLCLTANIVHLLALISERDYEKMDSLNVLFVLTGLLDSVGQYVTSKQSNLSHWHPVLGWFSVSLDIYLQSSMDKVKNQLARLWSPSMLLMMMKPLLELVDKLPDPTLQEAIQPAIGSTSSEASNSAKQFLKRALERTKPAMSESQRNGHVKLGSPECRKVALVCTLYQSALKTLAQLKLEILAGLCYQNVILIPLWRLMQSFGPKCGLKSFLDHLSVNPKGTAPEFQILMLFCDCLTYLATILDDIEMYERQTPLTLLNYAQIIQFINLFLYKAISNSLILDSKLPLFASLHSGLVVLYNRDNRRHFTPPGHWLIKEIRVSSFVSDVEKGKKPALLLLQKMPHIIPHEERVLIFRQKVTDEKSVLGLNDPDASSNYTTLLTIHRSRIVEDGYNQLSSLSPNALKGLIRVKFINYQGLDEAGIDQDGVFKEFLEETIKKVFDPGLNLFCTTSDERLYPSPSSHLTDNHLHLFEFVGKMIGKAVYEGILVDVPFAPFFLSQVLGKDHSAFYSYIDELPSLDAELYRNLTYMKHYEGDVSDLDLTFSIDQDLMGQIVTHELVPGGRAIAVTNENKFSYMHHVAYFRMHSQIKAQIAAFTRGFRTLIPNKWLELFSPSEVQRLISGDNAPLDLKDLKRNTHYYGGFHASHRVVCWLWEILEKDFDAKERSAFLKFVTSCSKPPLLGFENLEPPFSIRCVEVGDDEDDGDTVGSVLRGFLSLRRKDPVNRLPTASTCFNLLKLPNYQKKSTLREKLRYAIHSNTGFELS